MNTIKNYVDTMFMNLPDNEELNMMKQEILTNMEEKFYELNQSGMSENEAIGLVISEFGNIDELIHEFDIRSRNNEESIKISTLVTLSKSDIDNYIAMKKSVGIGVGVGVILTGIAVTSVLFGVHLNIVIGGLIPCLLIMVVAISLFIINGIKHHKFDYLEKGFLLQPSDYKYIEQENKQNEKSFVASIIIGVSLCIVSAIPVLIGSQHTQNILLYVPMTIVIAVIGCFFLIYAGNTKSAYTFLLENGIDSSVSEEELAKKLFWKKFNENFWLIIVAVYLLLSFVFNMWHISWLIFPVAGVLSGIWIKNQE